MSDFDSAGHEDIRTYIQNNWPFVALVDDSGTEVTRIDVNNDSRASWSSGPTSNPLEITITITGGDSDMPALPVTFAWSESYKTSGSSTRMAPDPFTNATLEAPADELTLTHQIEHPPQ